MDLCLEDETFGVHQQVTLTAFDLLASVITALFSAHRCALDLLGIDHPGAGLRISFQANPKALANSPIDPFPGTVDAPGSEVVIDGRPSREVVGKKAPLTTAFEDVEDGVQDLTKVVSPRPSVSFGSGHVRLDVVPFGIGKIRWVRFSHTC
jgi:hypothetical protein